MITKMTLQMKAGLIKTINNKNLKMINQNQKSSLNHNHLKLFIVTDVKKNQVKKNIHHLLTN